MCDASTIDYLRNGPVEAPLRIALAHGAGQGMDSDFMNLVAEGLGDKGFEVLRFEFPHGAGAHNREESRTRPHAGSFGDVAGGYSGIRRPSVDRRR